MTGLDPSSPLVLDTRALNLPRRAGSMITVTRTVPSPVDMGVALARVLPDSPVELDLRLESVLEGVLVSGSADVHVDAECARCLDPLDWDEVVEFSELFVYPATDARGAVVEELVDDDEDLLPRLQDDMLDLEATLRDAVVLGFPLAPVCQSDCAGLCSVCGVRLDDHPGHLHEQLDPRWAALTAVELPDTTEDQS